MYTPRWKVLPSAPADMTNTQLAQETFGTEDPGVNSLTQQDHANREFSDDEECHKSPGATDQQEYHQDEQVCRAHLQSDEQTCNEERHEQVSICSWKHMEVSWTA